MKRPLLITSFIILAVFSAAGQKSSSGRKATATVSSGNPAIVIDERLSVLREEPSLYAMPIKRFELGTRVTVLQEKKGSGVSFYKVSDNTAVSGWIQSESIAGSFRKNEDQRVARLILGSEGFVQVHRSVIFLELFKESPLQPTILLLLGDVVEEEAAKISVRAEASLRPREMAAAAAPLHSFYLNYHELDRYQLLGIRFLFNLNTKTLHYNGDSWFQITRNFPNSPITIEARERIKTLTEKMKAVD